MAGTRISLPRRRGRYRFALTPLADAMFQLLVFFMLSSNLSPYALLDVRSGALAGTAAAAGGGGAARSDAQSVIPAAETAVWSVSDQGIVASGQRLGFDRLPQLARALQAAGTTRVLLITRPDAKVQHVVTTLEALSLAGIGDVQIAGGANP